MKCPKCGYVSFDNPARCRHCGFDFDAAATTPVDLPLRGEPPEALGPPSDLPLSPEAAHERHGQGRARPMAPATPFELPLFTDGPAAEGPGAVPRPPRAPLSVRRSAVDPSRARPRQDPTPQPTPRLEFSAEMEPVTQPVPPAPEPGGAPQAEPLAEPRAAEAVPPTPPPAPLVRRVGAGLFDLALLASIDLLVVHFTLQLTGLDWGRVGGLPWAPFLAFIALINGGYVTVFTMASGQTIGQMLTGVRVVDATGGHLTLGSALARTSALALSWVPAGLGFLPMLMSSDRRALHDRLVGTRVVRD